MRVAMLINKYLPVLGGAERQVYVLSSVLARQGAEMHVLARAHPSTPSFERVDGVCIHRMPAPWFTAAASPSFTLHALGSLLRINPHLIHAHDLMSCATTALLAKRMLGIPVVATAHRSGPLGDVERLQTKPLSAMRLRAIRRDVDAFVIISKDIDAELAGQGIVKERRVIIANGIDTSRFRPAEPAARQALRTRLGIGEGPVAVFTGRLAAEKRVDTLISVWPEIRLRHPSASLLVVGAGPQEDQLRSLAGPGVIFTGASDDVLPFLQAADVFVLPSVAEGLSISLLEGLAAGLAVVATDVGGARDVIDHEVHGLIIEPGSAEQLRGAILRLFADEAMRQRLGEAGRSRVVRNHDVSLSGKRLADLYGRLLAGRSADNSAFQVSSGALRQPD